MEGDGRRVLNDKLHELDMYDLNYFWGWEDEVGHEPDIAMEVGDNEDFIVNGMHNVLEGAVDVVEEGAGGGVEGVGGGVEEGAVGGVEEGAVGGLEEGAVGGLELEDVSDDEFDFLGYDSDSGCEEDGVNEVLEVIRGVNRCVTLDKFRRNNNVYCANLSFVMVTLINGNERKLCFMCFNIYQRRVPRGSYKHYNEHYKVTSSAESYKHYCYFCNGPLYQITFSDICVG